MVRNQLKSSVWLRLGWWWSVYLLYKTLRQALTIWMSCSLLSWTPDTDSSRWTMIITYLVLWPVDANVCFFPWQLATSTGVSVLELHNTHSLLTYDHSFGLARWLILWHETSLKVFEFFHTSSPGFVLLLSLFLKKAVGLHCPVSLLLHDSLSGHRGLGCRGNSVAEERVEEQLLGSFLDDEDRRKS